MKFFKILNMFGKGGEKRVVCGISVFVLFAVFVCSTRSYADEKTDVFIRGNAFGSVFFGRNNIALFGLRNLELGGKSGKEFFFVKGVADIRPYSYSVFMAGSVSEQTIMPFYERQSGGELEEFLRLKELFISTRGLPFVRVMLGRFFARVGELNSQTFWWRNFVERPFTIRRFFGYDGFLDEGFEFSFSPPLPWTFEFALQVFDGSEDPWRSPGSFDFTYLVSLKNTFGTPRVFGGFSIFWVVGKNKTAPSQFSQFNTIIRTQNLSEFFGGDAFVSLFPYFSVNIGYILGRIQRPGILDVEGGLYSEFAITPVDFLTIGIRPEVFGLPRITFFEGGGSIAKNQIFEISLSATFRAEEGVKGRVQWTGNFGQGVFPQNIIYLQAMFEIP